MSLFRANLLDGCAVGVVDGSAGLIQRLSSLRARVVSLSSAELGVEGAAAEWAASLGSPGSPGSLGSLDALVCETGNGDLDALDRLWPVIQGVAAGALIPAGAPAGNATRKVVLIGSRASAPVRAALENLARTLSVEWARYGIVATAIAPGPATAAEDVETMVAFLCSPAGHYYSGCTFSFGAVTDPS